MGKKKSRAQYTSRGSGRNVSKSIRKDMRRDTTPLQRSLNKQNAWMLGKNVMITIPNPIKSETDKPFIRVSAKDKWNNYRYYIMSQKTGDGV